jgi:hypothetical protein
MAKITEILCFDLKFPINLVSIKLFESKTILKNKKLMKIIIERIDNKPIT